MKRLRFIELILYSPEEKGARRVRFDPKLTVIKGPNDTGKSSILKSLYAALGATPAQVHPTWKTLSPFVLLSFSIDGVVYKMLQRKRSFTLFDHEGRLVKKFNSVTKDLGPYLADLFEFRLFLTEKKSGRQSQATPAFLFLPFCMDQDKSWTGNWSGFDNLLQYSRWRTPVVDFHTGIKPSQYYTASAAAVAAKRQKEDLGVERRAKSSVREKLERDRISLRFDLSLDSYREQVGQLVKECQSLKLKEEDLRSKLRENFEHRYSLEKQKLILKHVVLELKQDFQSLVDMPDEVRCPTCDAVTVNSFNERFHLALDFEGATSRLEALEAKLQKINESISALEVDSTKACDEAQRVEALLQTRREEVTLLSIIQSEGLKEVGSILKADIDALDLQVGKLVALFEEEQGKVKKLSDPKRKATILNFYHAKMDDFLNELMVTSFPESSYKKIDAKVSETGSDLPRALLAYYFSILHTIEEYSTSTFCPIVIDSPNQQDQDRPNWLRMLQFIRNRQQPSSQIVLALVDDLGVTFDGTVIELREREKVLCTEDYVAVKDQMEQMIGLSLLS